MGNGLYKNGIHRNSGDDFENTNSYSKVQKLIFAQAQSKVQYSLTIDG
jgi:hypothetical protein